MSERARERIALRYYQSWLESSIGYRSANEAYVPKPRFHLDGSALRPSNDRTLVAFAQLGCLRLGVKRGVVTLISATRQYILSEATKTTSLGLENDDPDEGDELWFGNASLPRHQGISADALDPCLYTVTSANGAQLSVPALVVNDIAKDERYRHRDYAGNGVNFYCGVPLTTPSGWPIGVYALTDDKPRNGLTSRELKFMQDMAAAIMEHLETVQNDSARFRGERLVLGLGRFMQGESHVSREPRRTNSDMLNLADNPKGLDKVKDFGALFKGMTITDADPSALRGFQDLSQDQQQNSLENGQTITTLKQSSHDGLDFDNGTGADNMQSEGSDKVHTTFVLEGEQIVDITESSQPLEVAQVFSRAANILRECATADGVVFYDAVSKNLAKGPATDREDSSMLGSGSSGSDPSQDSAFDSSDREDSSTASISGDDRTTRILSSRGKICRMLGYSLDISGASTANANTIKTLALSEASLRRLIRRYPKGKMFYFSEQGGPSSDSDQPVGTPSAAVNPENNTMARPKTKTSVKSSSSIAAELIRAVPGARSVMWLPLWDFTKRRWSAGSFMWSRRPDRLLHGQSDLTYLRTFASCIMGEIVRIEAISADTARTTFMANISHELRSPLHGILGSVEFLQETTLDDFQSSMSSAIETCSRTLLDTVESVLHHAKINDLLQKRLKGKNDKESESTFERDFDLAVIIEDVVEAVYSGHTFISTGKVQDTFGSGDAGLRPAEATRLNVEHANSRFSDAVKVILKVQKLDNWYVYGQPGAIRRILMNLFGNALKYTEKGTVTVSLTSELQSSSNGSSNRFCITVTDTGIGMTQEFLKNDAFTAFTQESRFSPGAGLGLNIVRQLVRAMRGNVEASSQQGKGTEVKVWLALPQASLPSESQLPIQRSDELLARVARKTKGQSICLLDPRVSDKWRRTEVASPGAVVQSSLQDLLIEWFGMRPMVAASMDNISADFFLYAEPPPIKYLLEQHGVHARNTEIPVIVMATNAFESSSLLSSGIRELTDIGRVVEVTSQPCGPQKLARILHRAMMRIAQLARDPQSAHSSGPADHVVHEDSRISEPYLGDSDSQQSIQHRLKRTHSDHPQPRRKDRVAAVAPNDRPTPIQEQSASIEAEDYGFIADRDEPVRTLSSPPPHPTRPLTPDQSIPSSSHLKPADALARSNADPVVSRVLLVDDNAINLKLLVAFMKKAGMQYRTAQNGAEALEAYKEAAAVPGARFAHVIMDIAMPIMDGVAATEEIRRFERKSNIVPAANIIALTGQASEATRKDMAAAGANEFKTKPMKFNELIRLLEKKLS